MHSFGNKTTIKESRCATNKNVRRVKSLKLQSSKLEVGSGQIFLSEPEIGPTAIKIFCPMGGDGPACVSHLYSKLLMDAV